MTSLAVGLFEAKASDIKIGGGSERSRLLRISSINSPTVTNVRLVENNVFS